MVLTIVLAILALSSVLSNSWQAIVSSSEVTSWKELEDFQNRERVCVCEKNIEALCNKHSIDVIYSSQGYKQPLNSLTKKHYTFS